MPESPETLQKESPKSSAGNGLDLMSDAAERVRADVEELIQGFDLQAIATRIEEFGKKNPVALALTALGLGMAVGLFMRAPAPREQMSEPPQ